MKKLSCNNWVMVILSLFIVSCKSGPLTEYQTKYLREHYMRCWKLADMAPNAYTTVVVLRIKLQRDTSLSAVEISEEDKARYQRDPKFRELADDLIFQIRLCPSPHQLPSYKYETWRDIEMVFDPRLEFTVLPNGKIFAFEETKSIEEITGVLRRITGNKDKMTISIIGNEKLYGEIISRLVNESKMAGFENIVVTNSLSEIEGK